MVLQFLFNIPETISSVHLLITGEVQSDRPIRVSLCRRHSYGILGRPDEGHLHTHILTGFTAGHAHWH